MNIAFYAPLKPPDHPVPSGDRRMARLLLEALELSGNCVRLASRLRGYDGAGDPVAQARIERLGSRTAARLAERWSEPGGQRPEAWFTYHSYYKAPDWLGPAVSRHLSIPYFIAEASHAPKRAGGPWDHGHRANAEAVRQAARVFCLNSNDIPCLRPLVDDPERLVFLAPFLETPPYRSAASDREQSRRGLAGSLGIDTDMPWLLAVGMMRSGDKLESYRALARALRHLTDRPWQLVIAGDGPARPEVEAALDTLGRNRIRFTGAVDGWTLPEFYAACDVMVWPAVGEAYGMALLEAQATGLPVVAARTGGVPGIVADGETGLLVPSGDDLAFAGAVRDLLDDNALRDRLRTGAFAATAARHDIVVAARQLQRDMMAAR